MLRRRARDNRRTGGNALCHGGGRLQRLSLVVTVSLRLAGDDDRREISRRGGGRQIRPRRRSQRHPSESCLQSRARRRAGSMKVVFPYPSYWPYVRRGAERCVHDLATYLSRRGHEVHIITSTPGTPRTAHDGDVKITYVRQFGNPLVYRYGRTLRLYSFGMAATRVLMKEPADVAHLHSYSGVVWMPLLRRALRMPYLLQI